MTRHETTPKWLLLSRTFGGLAQIKGFRRTSTDGAFFSRIKVAEEVTHAHIVEGAGRMSLRTLKREKTKECQRFSWTHLEHTIVWLQQPLWPTLGVIYASGK